MTIDSQVVIIKGQYADAKIFTPDVDEDLYNQVQKMVNHVITKDCRVRIMPDAHIGKGSTVGTTIKLPENRSEWKISPNVVGVDIGCGMYSVRLKEQEVDLEKIDQTINEVIPAGFNIHPKSHRAAEYDRINNNLNRMTFKMTYDKHDRVLQSIGTLGGGNHFIELSHDENDRLWLTVHSGSRHLGVQIAAYHQELAEKYVAEQSGTEAGELAFLEGELLDDYLNDAAIAQDFATTNRFTMLETITDHMNLTIVDGFDSIHNFVDIEKGMVRKGATAAEAGERLLIPFNMRDGSIIAIGKGNEDWNNSAPHGAGRILSRSQARKQLRVNEFQQQMKGIYTTSVSSKTLDEAPGAYKPTEQILEYIKDTIEIDHHLKPLYNFKSH